MMSGLVDTMVADRIADGTHDAWVTRDPAENRGYERFGDRDERDEEVVGQLDRKTSLQLLQPSQETRLRRAKRRHLRKSRNLLDQFDRHVGVMTFISYDKPCLPPR